MARWAAFRVRAVNTWSFYLIHADLGSFEREKQNVSVMKKPWPIASWVIHNKERVKQLVFKWQSSLAFMMTESFLNWSLSWSMTLKPRYYTGFYRFPCENPSLLRTVDICSGGDVGWLCETPSIPAFRLFVCYLASLPWPSLDGVIKERTRKVSILLARRLSWQQLYPNVSWHSRLS